MYFKEIKFFLIPKSLQPNDVNLFKLKLVDLKEFKV